MSRWKRPLLATLLGASAGAPSTATAQWEIVTGSPLGARGEVPIARVSNAGGDSLSVFLDNNAGVRTHLPLYGDALWRLDPQLSRGVVDARNPLIAELGRAYARWLDAHGTEQTTLTACYRGICRDFHMSGNESQRENAVSTPQRVLSYVHQRF